MKPVLRFAAGWLLLTSLVGCCYNAGYYDPTTGLAYAGGLYPCGVQGVDWLRYEADHWLAPGSCKRCQKNWRCPSCGKYRYPSVHAPRCGPRCGPSCVHSTPICTEFPVDCGVTDCGIVDCGVMDCGVMDCGVMDYGVMDCGVIDGGVVDYGTPGVFEGCAPPHYYGRMHGPGMHGAPCGPPHVPGRPSGPEPLPPIEEPSLEPEKLPAPGDSKEAAPKSPQGDDFMPPKQTSPSPTTMRRMPLPDRSPVAPAGYGSRRLNWVPKRL